MSQPNICVKFSPWEDFLFAIGDKKVEGTQYNCQQPDTLLPKTGVVAQTKYMPAARRRAAASFGKNVQESLPPWYKIIADKKKVKEREIRDVPQKWDDYSKKHDTILSNLKNTFHKVVKMHSTEIAHTLANRADAYRVQLECIELNCFFERDMKRMRRKVHKWRQDVTGTIEKASPWYDELKRDQIELKLNLDADTNGKMQSLAKYMDIKPSDIMKAKICLITLSLPIYELCVPSMIHAVKFVVCNVMEIGEECLIEWLRSRNLVRKDWNLLNSV